MSSTGIKKAVEAMQKLRSPRGCNWDKAQTHQSLKKYLLEETYETLEAIDNLQAESPQNIQSFKDELGDLLFQVVFHAQLAAEKGYFNFDDLGHHLAAKLERRHPHVFGEVKDLTADEVTQQWEHTKKLEQKKDSVLDGIPPLPALARAAKVIDKVSKLGFQWPNLQGPLEKFEEEIAEWKQEIKSLPLEPESIKKDSPLSNQALKKIESEMGDVLFTVANIAYFLNLDPEDSLRKMLGRFENRFRHVELRAKAGGKAFNSYTLEELDVFWNEAKNLEKSKK